MITERLIAPPLLLVGKLSKDPMRAKFVDELGDARSPRVIPGRSPAKASVHPPSRSRELQILMQAPPRPDPGYAIRCFAMKISLLFAPDFSGHYAHNIL